MLGSPIDCDLLSDFSQTLPESIQNELDSYKTTVSGRYHDLQIEGLYEDSAYKVRIPVTYTKVDKDINIYIGTVEATVIKNNTNYDIFIYSQQPVSQVVLNNRTLTKDNTTANPFITKYNVTASPNGDLVVTLKNGKSINFAINL